MASGQQQESETYQKERQNLQQDLKNYIQSRQRLESQLQENKGVQQEFAKLDSDSNIYKLVGPVLLKQDKAEAIMAVDARLEFISNEIKRVEKQINEIQTQYDSKVVRMS